MPATLMNHTHSSLQSSALSRKSMKGPPHLPGLTPLTEKSKNHDIEFGFDMFKLSKEEAARVAKLLISDASKKIGTRA